MNTMPLVLTWPDLGLRLLSSILAGIIIGYNRGEHGKAAGVRTTVLVCVAATLAMLQVNLLLPMGGKASDSFITNDLMRLPLGILTGVGFIGGGAILRRGELVTGVTTAATIWYVTMMGLCFGGGQVILGWIATTIGILVLWFMKWLEGAMPQQFRSRLTVTATADGLSAEELQACIREYALIPKTFEMASDGTNREFVCELTALRKASDIKTPPLVDYLIARPDVHIVRWKPLG
ncbi:MAG: MgtC/SapB family protein [Variibacter sp.]